jgi:hypothetical protein
VSGNMPESSRFGREFSDFWVCVEGGHSASDTQSGFRAYPLKYVSQLPLASRHYNLEVEVITRAIWAGLKTQSVPIRVEYSPATNRASSFKPFLDNARISLLHTRLVLRQLLPIPHPRLVPRETNARSFSQTLRHFWFENASPLGLAAAVAISALLGILIWPWAIIPVAYLAIRLHLNKFAAAATLAICAPRYLPQFCLRVGHAVASPTWARFVGTHIVAFTASPVAALLVYFIAKLAHREQRA